MNRPHLSVIKPFLLAMLLTQGASGSSFGARSLPAAPQQQPQSSEKLYETAKRQFEAGSYAQALETIEGLLKVDADYAPALLLKTRALIGMFVDAPPLMPYELKSPAAIRERKIRQARLLNAAAESLERFLQLKPDTERAASLQEQLRILRIYAEPATKPESEWTFFSSSEVTEKAHIIKRPEPRYPPEARGSVAHGKVELLLTLAADSTVRNILVLKSSHPLLTEASVRAAQGILFEPAIKDGRPVSTAISIEYNFQTY